MKDILIAYPAEDKKTAKILTQKLKETGYSCKMYPGGFQNKKQTEQEPKEILKNMGILVILYSDFTEKSTQISNLLPIAWDMDLKIIPFKTGKVRKTLSSEIFLHQFEWVDAYDDGFNTAFEILLEIISETYGGKAPKKQKNKNKSGEAFDKQKVYIIAAIVVVLLLVGLFVGGVFDGKKSATETTQRQVPQNKATVVQPGEDLTDKGDLNNLSENEKRLVGEWVVADYSDNQNISEAEKEINRKAIVGKGRLIFNADKRFFRVGFTPDVQKAGWEFDLEKKRINLLIGDKKEAINLASFSDSSFTLLNTERSNSPGNTGSVTTRIVFKKK